MATKLYLLNSNTRRGKNEVMLIDLDYENEVLRSVKKMTDGKSVIKILPQARAFPKDPFHPHPKYRKEFMTWGKHILTIECQEYHGFFYARVTESLDDRFKTGKTWKFR